MIFRTSQGGSHVNSLEGNGIPWDRHQNIPKTPNPEPMENRLLGISLPIFFPHEMGAAAGTELLKTKFHDSPEVYALSRTSKDPAFWPW